MFKDILYLYFFTVEMMDKVDYVFVSKEFARALGLENKEAAVETLVTRCKPG